MKSCCGTVKDKLTQSTQYKLKIGPKTTTSNYYLVILKAGYCLNSVHLKLTNSQNLMNNIMRKNWRLSY